MPPRERQSLFITFEGADGSGKTTQSKILADRIGALWTREPGGTALGAQIRSLCLGDTYDPSDLAELLLMGADRAHHVDRLIRPALETNHVVCDRYTHSTIAYQGAGRSVDPELVLRVCELATSGLNPDVVVLIDLPVERALARQAGRAEPDRMEKNDQEFKERVRQSYLDQSVGTTNMLVVDGDASVELVAERVWDALVEYFGSRLAPLG